MAATIRTSTGIASVAPTGITSRSCSTRSSFTCERGGHLADLVEEEGAAPRRREESLLVAHRAGEGALHVAEQLALQQALRQRAAVDREERALGPGGQLVDVARDDFLAGAALALDQHRRVGGRHLLGELEHVDEALGLADAA